MANVNLKTDFKNGDTLMDYQLNNNFAAIQAALDAMNSIIWQDNADKVVTFRGTTEELMNREIIDGQILYDTTTGESYIDYEGSRISTGSGNAIHIGDTEPTNNSTQLWINDDELSAVGSEVVNSLEGNEENMAPSVAAVNNALTGINGKLIGEVLFSNNEGTNEEITLSKVVNNFDYIKIFYKDNWGVKQSIEVDCEESPFNVALFVNKIIQDYNSSYSRITTVIVDNDKITPVSNQYGIWTSVNNAIDTSANNILITKVVGFKFEKESEE